MTRLLVSVRSAEEARRAVRGGADLIDVKEPARGALGAADSKVWRDVVSVVAGRRPCSAALGELRELDRTPSQALDGLPFVKAGLAGCAAQPNWWEDWRGLRDDLPTGVRLVAVAYADQATADSPPPEEVLERAASLQLPLLLIDTFSKRQGALLEHLSAERLRALIECARKLGMATVVAGSLTAANWDPVLAASPDWVGVRGAVCEGNRRGALSERRVRVLRNQLASQSAARAQVEAC